MMKFRNLFRTSLIGLTVTLASLMGGSASEPLNFKEVFSLLRTNLMGMDEVELNRAAAEGLINQLRPKVMLMTNQLAKSSETNASAIARTAMYDRSFAYIRMEQIQPGANKALLITFKNLSSSNRIRGLVLDLRFADGQDYDAAAAVADCFFSTEQPLIDFGTGLKKSTTKTNALNRPLAILVNGKTAGAAEALAAMVRQADLGIEIGSQTAGLAAIAKEYTLQTGQRLRVATAPIKVGKEQPIGLTGLKPDISVDVNLQDELVFVQDGYKDPSRTARLASTGSGTNLASSVTNRSRPRNEAELVRMLREGESFDESNATARGSDVVGPVLHDPALARALDILKGLSVLRQFRTL